MSSTAAIRQFLKGCHLRNFDPKSREGSMVRVFDVEHCDICDGEILAANSMVIEATDGQLRFVGLRDRAVPDEGGYCEALEATTCTSCYKSDEGEDPDPAQEVINAKVW